MVAIRRWVSIPTCNPQYDVVGHKNGTLRVALQKTEMPVSEFTGRAMFTAVCKNGEPDLEGKAVSYYGSPGELCVECPNPGAICPESSFDDPPSQKGFWRIKLDLSCAPGSGYGAVPGQADAISCVAFKNVKQGKRAVLGDSELNPPAGPRCPQERWNRGLEECIRT